MDSNLIGRCLHVIVSTIHVLSRLRNMLQFPILRGRTNGNAFHNTYFFFFISHYHWTIKCPRKLIQRHLSKLFSFSYFMLSIRLNFALFGVITLNSLFTPIAVSDSNGKNSVWINRKCNFYLPNWITRTKRLLGFGRCESLEEVDGDCCKTRHQLNLRRSCAIVFIHWNSEW